MGLWRKKQWSVNEENPTEVNPDTGTTIQQAVDSFIAEVRTKLSDATIRSYRQILEWFLDHTKKEFIFQTNRSDILGGVLSAGRQARLNQERRSTSEQL